MSRVYRATDQVRVWRLYWLLRAGNLFVLLLMVNHRCDLQVQRGRTDLRVAWRAVVLAINLVVLIEHTHDA